MENNAIFISVESIYNFIDMKKNIQEKPAHTLAKHSAPF